MTPSKAIAPPAAPAWWRAISRETFAEMAVPLAVLAIIVLMMLLRRRKVDAGGAEEESAAPA